MRLSLKCAQCGNIFINEEEDLCVEIDFLEKKIRFVCRSCKYINELDVSDWQAKQKSSPLPRISTAK